MEAKYYFYNYKSIFIIILDLDTLTPIQRDILKTFKSNLKHKD